MDAILAIIEIVEKFPEFTHSQIAARVSYLHNLPIARQTVTDILSGRRRKVLRDAIDKRSKDAEK
jgi:hypothetical protein